MGKYELVISGTFFEGQHNLSVEASDVEMNQIFMPALSSTMTEGKISEVRVRALGLGLGLDRGQDLRG